MAPLPTPAALPPSITIANSVIVASAGNKYVIGSQTLSPSAQITYLGTVYSLAPNGNYLVIGGTTTQAITTPIVGSVTALIIGDQTLCAGGPALTIAGTTISLPTGGSSIVINKTTQPLASILASTTPAFIIAGSHTLVAGGPVITVSGQVASLQSGGASVVVGGKTEVLSAFLGSSTTSTEVGGLGGIIATIGGFGPEISTGIAGGGYNGPAYVGGSQCLKVWDNLWVGLLGVLTAFLIF